MTLTPFRTRLIRIFGALLLLGSAIFAAFLVPSGDSALVPRPTVELGDRIVVGGRSAVLNGRLDLVGVGDRPLSVAERLIYQFRDDVQIVRDTRDKQDEIVDKRRMERSKEVSAALALDLAGQNVRITGNGALVEFVDPEGPASGLLQSSDHVLSVNGIAIDTAADLTERVSSVRAGSVVRLGVRRDGLPRIVRIKTEPSGVAGRRSRIAVNVSTMRLDIELPTKVAIKSNGVVGPSAGLPFAIGIYDAATQPDLLKGRHVAATGELALTGDVLAVGGVVQKAIAAQRSGAELFLVPEANVEDALRGVELSCKPPEDRCLEILPVQTFEQAIDRLKLSSEQLTSHLAR